MERLKGTAVGTQCRGLPLGNPQGSVSLNGEPVGGEGQGSRKKAELLHGPLPNFFPEFSRRWCVLSDGILSYYENERAVTPNGEIRAGEIVCLAVSPLDTHG